MHRGQDLPCVWWLLSARHLCPAASNTHREAPGEVSANSQGTMESAGFVYLGWILSEGQIRATGFF